MIKLRSYACTVALAVVATGVIFSSCLKDKNDTGNVNNPAAGLMVVNLAPDKFRVGFAIDNNSMTGSPLGYENYNGGYASVYPGQRTISAFDFNDPASVITQTASAATLDSGKYYSAFLIGAAGNYRVVAVADNFDSLVASPGKGFIRYVNAIPDSVSQPGVTITASGASPVTSAAGFGTVSAFAAVNKGNLVIAIKNSAGVDTSRTIAVEQSKLYTVLFSGLPGSAVTPVDIKFIVNGQLDSTRQAAGTTGIATAVITK